VDFAREVLPLFANSCFSCHGPNKQEAQFRLDVREIALKGGELGTAIVPGDSAHSLLVLAIAGAKADLKMPKKGTSLTAEQIGLVRAWIDQGAVWPESASVKLADKKNHWAFKAPVKPKPPELRKATWPKNPIDGFVLAKLNAEKLEPSPEADRRTLLRRVTLDLTGLPPTLKEIENFLGDKTPGAYERVVERLLKSPHYGERWARHWLDLARYADTNGYEKDKPRSIWPYRDWVIRAFNDDMPFDEFAIEQLAGDLLPNPTVQQRVATGFLRNSMLNQEGGVEPEQFRVEALVDRVDTFGKAFAGLTFNCCQCHNHKYDPFSQKEYYQLYAFLNNDEEAFVEVPTPEQSTTRATILKAVATLEDKAIASTTNLSERLSAWEARAAQAPTNWTTIEPQDWRNFATKFEKLEDGSLLGGGDLQLGGLMQVWADAPAGKITAFRLDALTNANLLSGGPGLVANGSFLVREFTVESYTTNTPSVTNKIKFRRALCDLEAPGFAVASAIDGEMNKGGWTPAVTPDQRNKSHYAIFECAEPVEFPPGTKLEINVHEKFDKDTGLKCHMIGCLRLSTTTEPIATNAVLLPPAMRLPLLTGNLSKEKNRELFDIFRHSDTNFLALNKEITEQWTNWPSPATSLALAPRATLRATHIFKRGDRLRPGEAVTPDVPEVLNAFPSHAPRNRLGLAQWLTDRKNPTTARVFVNRLWQAYFGQGLVTTPEDFGTRVDAPSHPQLLDWLACELMDSNWNIKHIHRLIVTSATYRQASKVTPELYERDQYNRLLARAPRLRVESEVVQDVALSVSGLLNSKIGGPSVYPPIPASVGDTVYGGFTWPESTGADRYRRGMYTFAKRSLPFPTLNTFDAPSGDTACPRRVRSNTPLQALTTLNEKTFVQAAQALAMRLMKEGGTNTPARIQFGFELCTGRKPDPTEVSKLSAFWQKEYDFFEEHSAAAVKVALPDPAALPEDLNFHKAAAWAMVSRAILNLDETFTRE
jgi:hypothetical protein